MAKFGFLAEFVTDAGKVTATVNSLPGCVGKGTNQLDTEKNLSIAMEAYIAAALKEGKHLKSDPRGNSKGDYQITAGSAGVSKYMEVSVDAEAPKPASAKELQAS